MGDNKVTVTTKLTFSIRVCGEFLDFIRCQVMLMPPKTKMDLSRIHGSTNDRPKHGKDDEIIIPPKASFDDAQSGDEPGRNCNENQDIRPKCPDVYCFTEMLIAVWRDRQRGRISDRHGLNWRKENNWQARMADQRSSETPKISI